MLKMRLGPKWIQTGETKCDSVHVDCTRLRLQHLHLNIGVVANSCCQHSSFLVSSKTRSNNSELCKLSSLSKLSDLRTCSFSGVPGSMQNQQFCPSMQNTRVSKLASMHTVAYIVETDKFDTSL